MRGIIISESKEVERLLNCESSSDWGIRMGKVVMLIGKYYYSLGLDRQEVYKSINSYLKERMDKYTPKKWSELVNNVLDTIEKNKWYNLIDIDSISITEAEWNTIVGIGNVKLEKIAFVLLCYVKVYKAQGRSKDRVENLSDILLEAKLKGSRENKLLFADLKDLGLIDIGNLRHMFVKPLYINEDGECFIYIDYFEDIYGYYDEYRNKTRYKKCEKCNKRFKINSKTKAPKLCKKCLRELIQEKDRLRKQK